MKICLVHPPINTTKSPPLGLAYLKSYLDKDHDIRIMDFNILLNDTLRKEILQYRLQHREPVNSTFKFIYPEYFSLNDDELNLATKLTAKVNEWVKQIFNFKPQAIGLYINVSTQLVGLLLAKKIKELDETKTIIFGGPNCNRQMALLYLKMGLADVIVQGEGEETFSKIINSLEKNEKAKSIPGCIIKYKDKIIEGGQRPLIKNLDNIPFPDFSDLPLKRYTKTPELPGISEIPGITGLLLLPILTSRGCVENCAFCNETKLWKTYRERSIGNIVKELKDHQERYGVNSFRMHDSLINGNTERLSKLCDEIIKSRLKISWFSNARINGLSKELLEKMHRAGCRVLLYGIESGSQRVLNLMRKNTNVKNIEAVLRWTKESGIRVYIGLITGFPGETIKDFKETIDFFIRNKSNIDNVAVHSCFIDYYADLRQNPEKYGIKIIKKEFQLPKEFNHLKKYIYPPANFWESGQNTRKERERRFTLLMKVLENLKKPSRNPNDGVRTKGLLYDL